jgi:SAM-dependent methyltransferase
MPSTRARPTARWACRCARSLPAVGILGATAEFLIDAVERGVRFDRTLTIGRQHLMVGPWTLARMLERAGMLAQGRQRFYEDLVQHLWFAEPLFSSLGARELESLDISGHEDSTILWDLNDPVPEELHERFDVVFDGGSLEHIFRAPIALESYMRMTRVGGHIIVTAPANNLFGHGFYQFGPEFFYASLNERNGFVVERMLAIDLDVDAPARLFGTAIGIERRGPGYEVADPARTGGRVALVNDRPVMVMVQARRVDGRPLFETTPQQSDYRARWRDFDSERAQGAGPRRTALAELANELLSPRVKLHLMLDILPRLAPVIDPARTWREGRRRSFRNERSFRRDQRS